MSETENQNETKPAEGQPSEAQPAEAQAADAQQSDQAKELKSYAEQLITLAKQGDLHARRLAYRDIRDQEILNKLFTDIGPRFKTRNGGYTRITKVRFRRGDNALMSVIELVGNETAAASTTTSSDD